MLFNKLILKKSNLLKEYFPSKLNLTFLGVKDVLICEFDKFIFLISSVT